MDMHNDNEQAKNESLTTDLTVAAEVSEDGFQRVAADNTLSPGYYWRLKNDFKVAAVGYSNYTQTLHQGDVHLLLDVFEYEGAPHTATILEHPCRGSNDEYKILIADFLHNFEPAHDAEEVRANEQAELMERVSAMQASMAQVQINPTSLPDFTAAIDKAVEAFQQKMVAETTATQTEVSTRQADLRKIHRRAARRSAAAGNPLTIKSATITDKVGLMIAEGMNSEGLYEMTYEAKKHIAIAEATAEWLSSRSNAIAQTLKGLTPFYAEKGKVALARAKKSITYVKEITKGLASLKLYTGDGVDTVAITEGGSAPAAEPLTLFQAKRYVDEELALWAEVEDNFDWRDQGQFFKAMKSNPALVDQVLPARRCVVSIAVTRRDISYGRQVSAYEQVMNEIRNKAVFLLIRDGDNVSAVYSAEPSHETTPRLFPTAGDLKAPFQGHDGSTIGLQDVAFGEAVGKHDDWALHYKRFLILLCGLDHRLKLMGDFYPQESGLQFMSLDFQEKYFHFIADDDDANLLAGDLEPVAQWIRNCNQAVRSGSRVVVSATGGISRASPQLERLHDAKVSKSRLPHQLIVTRSKGSHNVSVPLESSRGGEDMGFANAWLDGPDAAPNLNWFLCLDQVRIETVSRYLNSRVNRAYGIGWIRTFKRVHALLVDEHLKQSALRSFLSKAAIENGILGPEEVQEAMEVAIATWRASKRGAAAPEVSDTKAVNDLLTLMFPADRLAKSSELLLNELIEKLGTQPLQLNRSGKTRLVLYVEASADDKTPYGTGLHWGWVKRVLIDVLKTKLSVASTSLVWLEAGKPNPTESPIRDWPAMQAWLQQSPEPCRLGAVAQFKDDMRSLASLLGPVLAAGRTAPVHTDLDEGLFERLCTESKTLHADATHFQHLFLTLPVGIMQRSTYGPLTFLYARTNMAHFVHHYGSSEQWSIFKRNAFYRADEIDRRTLNEIFKWTLVQTSEPVKALVQSPDCLAWNTPDSVTVERHKTGGLKKGAYSYRYPHHKVSTRAERRAKNGNPQRVDEKHVLSWNRRFQAILGLAPHLKKEFYKKGRWPSFGEPAVQRQFVPPRPMHDLSPLVWDEEKGGHSQIAIFH